MTNQDQPIDLDKIRQQYDFLPYPESEINLFPTSLEQLYIHSLATPYYLRYQTVVNTHDKIILDAGCGSGMQALALAAANPGAKIIGVDLSERSVELARQRFAYHNIDNAEFHAISLDDIQQLGYKFDLINCDEVLYLLPDPGATLKLFHSVLSSKGIIRSNLHSYHQRVQYYRTQELFQFVGLYNEDSVENALAIVKESLDNLQDSVRIKTFFQHYSNNQLQNTPLPLKDKLMDEWLLTNYLLRGDKGYTIPELFDFLENANLNFLSMVNWRHWNVADLFKNQDNLPLFWEMGLESASEAEKLHLYELFNPVHRLLDFWCVNDNDSPFPTSPISWRGEQWSNCLVSLHPILRRASIKEDLLTCISQRQEFEISQYVKFPSLQPVTIDSTLISCLLPLWEAPQSFTQLVAHWLAIQPLCLDTLEPKTEEQSFWEISQLLIKLETFTYILLELTD
ncbi:MAG: SAM-dependent methyltransferase [Snowella sp.]|nr:MAG: SAM-dependent methyltransferase [Snowella sp.]